MACDNATPEENVMPASSNDCSDQVMLFRKIERAGRGPTSNGRFVSPERLGVTWTQNGAVSACGSRTIGL